MSSEKSKMKDPDSGRPLHMGVRGRKTGPDPGTVPLRIDGLAAGGRGVARHEGVVWFVEGGLPGDRVQARPLRRHRRHVDAAAVTLVEAGPGRRPVPCAVQGRCGGCPWMALDEADQRAWKDRLLREALARIGRIAIPDPEPTRTPSRPLGYRNRVEFTVRAGGGEPARVGLHGARARMLVEVERCWLQDESANAVLSSVREFFADETLNREPPVELRLAIRRSELTGRILVSLRESPPSTFRRSTDLARFLEGRHPLLAGVVLLRAGSGGRGGTRTRVLVGRDRLDEQVGSFRIELPAASFAQVSAAGAAELVRLVGDLAMPVAGSVAIDLYGGVGLFGLELARRGAIEVTVCDADADAIAGGVRAAAAAGWSAVRHVHADVARFLAERSGVRADVLVANPPRGGLGRGVAPAIRSLHPARLVLVSCDPATLARDLARLVRDGPYRVERLVPLDLFPQTAHLETVALLRSSEGEGPRPGRPGGSRPPARDSG